MMNKKGLLTFTMLLLLLMTSVSTSAIATDTTLSPILVIGSKGTASGQFDEPDSVFVSNNGTIFAGDTSNLRVQVFASDGTYKTEYSGVFTTSSANEVQGLAQLSNSTLVVVEKAGNLFFFNTTTGALINKVDLSTLVADSQIDTQGLAVDTRTDTIYISNQPVNHILMIAGSNGSLIGDFYTSDFSTPENIAVDLSRDRIYISLEGIRKIGYYNLDGTFIGAFGKDDVTYNYEGLAVDKDGLLWAVDEGPDEKTEAKPSRIVLFSPENFTALYSFGGTSPGSAEGQFYSPDGIAYDTANDRLIIADQGNYRLQLFSRATALDHKATPPATSSSSTSSSTSSNTSNTKTSPISEIFIGLAVIALPIMKKYR